MGEEERLSEERLVQIVAKWKRGSHPQGAPGSTVRDAEDSITELLAEIERLRGARSEGNPVAALSEWWAGWREARPARTPQDVIARLCTMQSQVAGRVFGCGRAADCICKESGFWLSRVLDDAEKAELWRYDEDVLRWIEDRVAEAIRTATGEERPTVRRVDPDRTEAAQYAALRADRERRGGEPEYDPARVEREARASMALAREDDRTEARGTKHDFETDELRPCRRCGAFGPEEERGPCVHADRAEARGEEADRG